MYQDKPSIRDIYNDVENKNFLAHYGTKRHSGRYPYGSGENPFQHEGMAFYDRVNKLREQNFTFTDENGKLLTGDTAIAKSMGLSTTKFRELYSISKDEVRETKVEEAKRLRDEGYSLNAIAEKMGYKNDSSVRSLLNSSSEMKMKESENVASFIKGQVDEKGMIDVGTGVDKELNISKQRLDTSLAMLEAQGYPVYSGRVEQVTNPGKYTTIKVICPPGSEHKDIYNYGEVHSLKDYISRDGGETIEKKFTYPTSMDSSRLKVRYAEEGGLEKDGLIELRRGVDDLSLGESRYSQVRILVDNDKYLKGLAVYSDDMPKGVDVVYYSNKKKGTPLEDTLKTIKSDPDNPFGSAIKDADQGGQYWYKDKKTGEKKLGLINKRADEGDWEKWKDKLPSQFLSKQNVSLAKKQLNLAAQDKQDEYNEICSLTNPTVKKKMLDSFAEECDYAAVHLYAAALPRQKYHVLVPLTSISDNEVYAPNYNNGEKIALVRYPHGGTFEIPILTVNNRNAEGKKVITPNSTDGIGINKNVADRLSGADFDGDTVMAIPVNDKVKIRSKHQLKGLEGFDPKIEYATEKRADGNYYNSDGKKIQPMTSGHKQNEMGRVSNLITDMTLKGATEDELARAVRHSMVIIDSEKHHLDYKKSYTDNRIEELKKKYQYDPETGSSGASTLISRAKSEDSRDKTQGTPKVNQKGKSWYDPSRPEGALIYKPADDLYYEEKKVNRKTGEVTYETKKRQERTTKMENTDDAYTLVSSTNTPMERVYADYANKMKSLANQARKESVTTGKIEYSKEAKAQYQDEVNSLMSKLNASLKNKPRERQAQLIATSRVKAKEEANPDLKSNKSELKKVKQQEISRAREIVGSKRTTIDITEKEWKAIQKGAIPESTLKKILDNTDSDKIRELATPKATNSLSASKIGRIKSLSSAGYSIAEIAKKLGISTSTVSKYLKS